MLKGLLGSSFAIPEKLLRAMPLILTGYGGAISLRAKFWNIKDEGQFEGQFYAGAIATTLMGTELVTLPPILLLPLIATGYLHQIKVTPIQTRRHDWDLIGF
jgi:ABC-type uncharacterized transport system permease subunit